MNTRIAICIFALCFSNLSADEYADLPAKLSTQIQTACMDRFQLRAFVPYAEERRNLFNYCVTKAKKSPEIRNAIHAVSAIDLAMVAASSAVARQTRAAINFVSAKNALSKKSGESLVRQLVRDEERDGFSQEERDRHSLAWRVAPHEAEMFFDTMERLKEAKAMTRLLEMYISDFLASPWEKYSELDADALNTYQKKSDRQQQEFDKNFPKLANMDDGLREFRSQWQESSEAQDALGAERDQLNRRARIIKLLATDIVRETISDFEDP